ncbi:hypothetical protein SAMN05216503_2769 [Polaribacter sp. KT25b]|uniref:hypothetical protein n=1 Tax=Polaribacter sp. KT25b TaxID=1855336 RepID=UPI00087A9249|nr:hypothetical protein [Polaribacter sp. KT25b]SDS34769.1 hypothetical protein SAMN05216503_2769 [Polaribacter sp. KT25b]
MKFKKIHFTLIFFAILPFLNFIHFDDYCFGIADLLIIGGLTIMFFISFLVITFYDLYNLSIRKLRFNFLPLLIVLIFSVSLFIGVKYQGKHFLKNITKSYKNEVGEEATSKILLFTDKTFEFQQVDENEVCYKKGTYYFKNDSLFLEKNDKSVKDVVFDSIYYFSYKENLLIPINKTLPNFKTNK